MAYHIQYGKPTKKERIAIIQNSSKIKIAGWIIVGVTVVLLGILGRFGMLDFLIPGNKEVTKSAFQSMLDDVKDGDSVKNAITTFCEEILAGAEYEN